MSATRTRNGKAPAQPTAEPAQPTAEPAQPTAEPAQPTAPAPLDIAAAVEAEDVRKAARVYEDVPECPRVPTPDGTLAVVQRERRADGTLGEYLLAEIRVSRTDKSESVQRYSIARVQALKTALESRGVSILR